MFEQTFKNIDDVLWKEAGCTTELDYTEQTSWMLFLKYLDDLEEQRATEADLHGRPYTRLIDDPHRWSTWAAPKKPDGTFDHDNALIGDDLIKFVRENLFPYLEGFRTRASGPDTIDTRSAKSSARSNASSARRQPHAARSNLPRPHRGCAAGAASARSPTTFYLSQSQARRDRGQGARQGPTPKASGRPRPTPRSCRRASPSPPTAAASTASTWQTGAEGYVERYPTPDELWAEVFRTPNAWRDRFAAVPFEERGGTWQTRYYQHNAIENALEAIAAGKQRILLTLATGTGKTAIAFQIAWALFQSRWNLSRKPSGGRASCSSPTATSWPIRPTTPSRPFPKTRSRASSRTKSARKAACRKTPPSSSRSSRPS